MNICLLRSGVLRSCLMETRACQIVLLQSQTVRCFTFKRQTELSRKEREIIRWATSQMLISSRRHVKEGNIITYVGASVNVLLSGMKVNVFSSDYLLGGFWIFTAFTSIDSR